MSAGNLSPPARSTPIAERSAFLRRVTFFARLEPSALEVLAARVQERVFESGQTLYTEGDTGDSCYVITAGHVQVIRQGEGSSEAVLAERLPGQVVGEM